MDTGKIRLKVSKKETYNITWLEKIIIECTHEIDKLEKENKALHDGLHDLGVKVETLQNQKVLAEMRTAALDGVLTKRHIPI